MPSTALQTGCHAFEPDQLVDRKPEVPFFVGRNFKSLIEKYVDIPETDQYVYHAVASVNLADVQRAIDHGRATPSRLVPLV